MTQTNKPISMRRDELMNKVTAAINESHLSYFLLEYIFKDLLNEIHNGAMRQAQAERAEYLKATNPDSETASAEK